MDSVTFLEACETVPAADKVHCLQAHCHLAPLVEHFDEGADDAAIRLGRGTPCLQNRYTQRQDIPGTHRLVPTQFISTGRSQGGLWTKIVIGIETHHQAGRVPAAGYQSAIDAILRRLPVSVVRHWNIALAKADNLFFFDRDKPKLMDGADDVIFKIKFFARAGEARAAHERFLAARG